MRKLFLFGLLLWTSNLMSQSLYDIGTIQDIRIYFGFSNWDYRMDTAIAGTESYTLADSVVVNGTRFTNCGIKFKGNSSYSATRVKNPLHIKLDFTTPQNYQGYEDLKLANGFYDASITREVLAYQILRQYMDAPLSNHAKVYINGSYYGIMVNDEDIGNKFLLEHYYSNNGTFFKCNPVNAGMGSGTGSSLLYAGTDSTSTNYSTKYELKSNWGWKNLISLCDTLNNFTSQINFMLDIDRVLWMLAFNDVAVNLDSYSGSFRQNFYLYRNHKSQWIPTSWDLNMCFGSFTQTGSGPALTLTSMQTMTPTLHSADANWPLISKLLANTTYKKMYIAHMRTINRENFLYSQYKIMADSVHTLVDNAVSTDPNYLYTYNQYLTNLDTSYTGGGPGGSTCGIYQLMDVRTTWLESTSDFLQVPPAISNVLHPSISPAYGSNATVTANVTGSTAVYVGYRYSKADRFVRTPMFDDGTHGDGAAGDMIFGASIPVTSLKIQYYIYAENAVAGMFSPERAEHEFYEFTATITMASSHQIVLNEVAPGNDIGLENENGKCKDWIEILNTTGSALGLHNLYLSDDPAAVLKWRFPDDAFILPNEHLIIWADDMDSTYVNHHTNFNLNNLGDSVILADQTSAVLESMNFLTVNMNSAVARCPDGTGTFSPTDSLTPGTFNVCVDLSDMLHQMVQSNSNILVYPNPASDSFTYHASEDFTPSLLLIYDINGKMIDRIDLLTGPEININHLTAGLYLLQFSDTKGNYKTVRLIKAMD